MSGFRTFLLFSVLIHAAVFGALCLWTPPEIRFVPPQGSVTVQFSAPSPPASTEEKEGETPGGSAPSAPIAAPTVSSGETPKAVLPEPISAPTVATQTKPEPPKVSPSPEKKKKTTKEKKKARPKPPAEAVDKTEKNVPQAQSGSTPQTSTEPQKELILGKGDAPSYARFLPPEYPPRARRQNIEGHVLLRVLVSKDGRAAEVMVVESSHPEFTRAARKSAQRSRYVPTKYLGQPVESWVLIPFHFKLMN